MFFRDQARPFKELNEDAAEFVALFEEDVNKCSEILDHMLSSLFLESRRDHASDKEFLVTFSKKKYEIYKSTSSLLNDLEEKWLKQISEMKKKFVENTEIYLAGFKASTEDRPDIIDPLRRASIANRSRDNYPGKNISLIDSNAGRLEELSAGVRKAIGINRETTPPLVTVNMSDVSSTEFSRNGRRRGTSNRIVDHSGVNTTVEEEIKTDQRRNTRKKTIDIPEICSTPPNVNKVRSRKGTPNRVAADRTVPNSKGERVNFDSYIEASTSIQKTPKKVQFAANDDDLDSNFSEDSLAEFDARQKSMHNYLAELKKHSPEGKDYGELISRTLKKSSEDPFEVVMPRSRDHHETIANTFEENSDPSEEVMPRSRDHQNTIANTFEENLDLDPPEKVMPKARGRRKTISSTLEKNLADPSEEVTPRSRDHQKTFANTFEENLDLDPPEEVLKARGRRKTISSTIEENVADLNPPEKGTSKARGGRRTISRPFEESLEDFNPIEKVTSKSSGRRKTISNIFEENLKDMDTTLHTSDQTSFKRKAISSLNAAPSPKRLRSGKRNSVASVTKVKEEPVNNPLECDSSAVKDNYTQWVLLQDLGSKISTKPGVYELKVWRAKKSAFIGSCENLYQKLELHKLGQSSGHKHLDKFLERNKNDVLVRYEEMPSFMVAKAEEKRRVESFIALHKTTPAYN